ncbi:MAG: HEAT repeat domain-containing protein [Planctomycetota bacterium]
MPSPPTLHALQRRLGEIGDPLVDRSLAAALPTAAPDTQRWIVDTLVGRQDAAALAEAVAAFDRLGEAAAGGLVAAIPRLGAALRAAIDRPDPAGALSLLGRAADPATAYLLGRPLRRSDREVAARAAEVLRGLAAHVRRAGAPPRAMGILDEAIDRAVADYATHRQPGTLVALLERLPARLGGWASIAKPGHAALEPMRRVLESCETAAARRAALWALGEPALAAAARTGLAHTMNRGEWAEPLSLRECLADPAVRRALAALPDGTARTLAQRAAELERPPSGTGRFVACLRREGVSTVGPNAAGWAAMGAEARAEQALAWWRSPRPTAERGERTDPAEAALAEAANQPGDPAIARFAARAALGRVEGDGCDRAAAWLASPHEPVREIARRRLAPRGFDWLWERWPKLDDRARLTVAAALIKIDPRLHGRLAAKLDARGEADRCRALRMVHDLNQGVFFQEQLTRLADDAAPAVSSAAVRALGTADSAESAHALRDALTHPDPATRASAVEAIARRGLTDATPRVAQIAKADDSEPRATAIAALHQTHPGSAIDALQRMLDDDRSDHRDRGLWLVESMGLVEMARQVAEMSLSDPDAGVRRRAEAVVAELMGLLSKDADATRGATDANIAEAHAQPPGGPTSSADAEAA